MYFLSNHRTKKAGKTHLENYFQHIVDKRQNEEGRRHSAPLNFLSPNIFALFSLFWTLCKLLAYDCRHANVQQQQN